MKNVFKAYRNLLGILFTEAPLMVVLVFMAALMNGVVNAISVWVNARIFSLGVEVAAGTFPFAAFIPYIILFVVLAVLPTLIGEAFIYSYATPKTLLILRTVLKGRMLQKLKRLKYEHLENEESMEIIDKAFNRAENSARHLFPMYIYTNVYCAISACGMLWLFATVRWWFLLTILVPFALETFFAMRANKNIYDEMEGYWKREQEYELLGGMLRSRDFIKENRIFQNADYLINTYEQRLGQRNHEYERFYFKNLRAKFTGGNLTKLAQIGNALLLLWLYAQGNMDIGLMLSLSLTLFGSLLGGWSDLRGSMQIVLWGGFHAKTFVYYDKFLELSERESGAEDELPQDVSIEFDNVHFKYPGTEREILRGLSFVIPSGEKISIVGANGEGKTTLIKLLLGLFQPDSGEIRIGGKPLTAYSQETRQRLFGPVFQDFVRYSMTLKENIAVGEIDSLHDIKMIETAIQRAKVDTFAESLPQGADTLLGRDFEGGVDISGGQWQRISIARAFMGEKPILILDEPTSQLDPMAESRLYSEFAEMSATKTAIFITHRLGSTAITDRILVISDGIVAQSGTHDELVASGGLYAEMWQAQRQWYEEKGGDISE